VKLRRNRCEAVWTPTNPIKESIMTASSTLQQAIATITPFMPRSELFILRSSLIGEERAAFIAKFDEIATVINTMPKTYEQDGKGDNAIVYPHYFHGAASNWYITEKDMEGDGTIQAFGYAILNGDTECAELGYISIAELVKLGVELDLYWTACTLAEVKGRIGA